MRSDTSMMGRWSEPRHQKAIIVFVSSTCGDGKSRHETHDTAMFRSHGNLKTSSSIRAMMNEAKIICCSSGEPRDHRAVHTTVQSDAHSCGWCHPRLVRQKRRVDKDPDQILHPQVTICLQTRARLVAIKAEHDTSMNEYQRPWLPNRSSTLEQTCRQRPKWSPSPRGQICLQKPVVSQSTNCCSTSLPGKGYHAIPELQKTAQSRTRELFNS